MSASSIKRFTLTRRVVASSGIAAALFVAGPVAVAAADDEASTTPSDSSTIGEVSTEAVETADSDSGSDSESSPDGADPSSDVTATSDDTTPMGAEVEPSPASETPATTTPVPAPAESPASDEPAESTDSPWFSTSPHHDAASDDTAEDNTDEAPSDDVSDEPVDTDTHTPLRDPLVDHPTPSAFEITVDAGEATAASDPVITAAAPIVDVDDEGSIFYQLTHGTGTEGLILFNQSAMMLGVLSRRGRGNGQDYAALLGPGESGFLPARVITEGSLAKHAWDDEADALSLSSSTVQRFFDRSLVALSSTAEVDPDNRFLDPSDSDWAGGWVNDVDATPPPGTSYSVGEDGSVTIHNDSDVDIAVISPYHGVWSEQGLAVIRPGQSHTIDETATNPLGFNAYWVQAERQDGRGVIIAQVMTAGGQVLVAPATEGYPDQSQWLPLKGTTSLDVDDLDPGDRFLDPSDDLATGGSDFELSYGNPETAGVNYSVVDEDHIRVHNDGTGTIAVTQSTPGGQLLGFDVLAPGESKVYGTVPGGFAVVSIQAERDADGKPVLLGGVISSPVDGTITGTPPSDGYPAIPLRDTPLPENHAPTGEVVAQPKPADQRERVYTVSGFDFDGDTLTFSVHTPPSRGTLVNNGDGTFTYTPTDPDDLHKGSVDDQFLIQISDGRGGTGLAPGFVFYSFDNINELPVIESVTADVDEYGGGAWLFVVTDPDGDTIGISDFDRPTYGEFRVEQVFEPGPVHGSPVPVPGTYTVVYRPDLVRAHESAYDDQFTVTFDDGHGGEISQTVRVNVPKYNQNPNVHVYSVDRTEGAFVDSATFRVDFTDDDGDTVTVTSVTTSHGGTVRYADGVLVYTPGPLPVKDSNGYNVNYYNDTITIIVEDGHGGQRIATQNVFVVNTGHIPWVEDGRDRTLIFDGDRVESDLKFATIQQAVWHPRSTWHYVEAQDWARQLEAEFPDQFAGYDEMLQRYVIRSYANAVVKTAALNLVAALNSIGDVVNSINQRLDALGITAFDVTVPVVDRLLRDVKMSAISPWLTTTRVGDQPTIDHATSINQAPRSTGELHQRLRANTSAYGGGFYTENVIGPDGTERVIVYVGGSASWNPLETITDQDGFENAASGLGISDRRLIDTLTSATQDNPGKEVLLVGYSQGGLDALNVADLGLFNVVGVVTFGTPVGSLPSSDYQSIHIMDSRDNVAKVAQLSGFIQRNREAGRLFESQANTPDDGPLSVHTNEQTYRQLGDQFDDHASYSEMDAVLREFRGPVTSAKQYNYAVDALSYIDIDYADQTAAFARDNPGVVWEEVRDAATDVTVGTVVNIVEAGGQAVQQGVDWVRSFFRR